MSKVLLIDSEGLGTDMGMQAQKYHHQVKHWVKPNARGERALTADGIIPRVEDWEKHMDWADIIIQTNNQTPLFELEKYRKQGYPIFGPNLAGADLEIDRELGLMTCEKAGIMSAPYTKFTTWGDAIAFVKANPNRRFVCKPCADVAKELSYVSKSGRDMLFMLETWAAKGKPKCPFIMQEFVKGIEMAVGGWVGPSGFSQWVCENMEFKKLMPSNYGPNTGEMGTLVRYVHRSQSKLFKDTLGRFEDYLKYIGYTGYIDLAFMINEKGPLVLEFTSRYGWPLRNIQTELHLGDPIKWKLDLLDGFDTLKVRDTNLHACGVAVCIPDFPYKTTRPSQGYPIYEWDTTKGVHLCDVMMGTAPNKALSNERQVVSAGTCVADVCAIAPTVKEAAKEAYERVKHLEIPNSPIVRDDIGERLEAELPELQKWGYATGWKYG